jgi:membrane-associated phospholipid phosphatase
LKAHGVYIQGLQAVKLLAAVLFCCVSSAFGQTEPIQADADDGQATAGTPAMSSDEGQQNVQPEQRNRSVLDIQPGTKAIKDTDLFEKTGYWHPFVRMPRFVLVDQKRIWTSPFHTSGTDAKWWLIFGAATAGFIAADQHIDRAIPANSSAVHLGNNISYLGDPYTLIPIAGSFYFLGSAASNERFRETGLLSFETLIDVTVVQLALKSIIDRERPNEGQGEGHFWASTSPRYNSSFPSGHAMQTFALASVFAHEYHEKFWVKFLAYAYAGTVVGARLAAHQHFPGDVVAGGAMGWFIGDYVYARRHNPDLDKKHSMLKNRLAHVEIGGGPAW